VNGAAAAKITIFCKTARKTVLSFTLGDELLQAERLARVFLPFICVEATSGNGHDSGKVLKEQ
jgi:hypothetical protein